MPKFSRFSQANLEGCQWSDQCLIYGFHAQPSTALCWIMFAFLVILTNITVSPSIVSTSRTAIRLKTACTSVPRTTTPTPILTGKRSCQIMTIHTRKLFRNKMRS